jgi:MFS family permease
LKTIRKLPHPFTLASVASITGKKVTVTWLVYAIILFTFIDLFTQLPVMSTYAASLGASASIAGFTVGLYSLTNMFGNAVSGIFTDRYGAGRMLKIGLLASNCALLSYSLILNVAGLLIVRFVHGFLSGLIVPAAFTYMANLTRREKQGSQSAITGSFVGIAAIAGPAYSGIMASRTSVPFVFATIAVLGIVLFAISLRVLNAKQGNSVRERRKGGTLRLNSGLLQAYTGSFFLMFSQGALAYLLPLHVESLGYSSRLSGMLMSAFGIVAVAIFLLPTNRLFDRVRPIANLSAGLGLMGISQILLGQSGRMMELGLVMVLYGIGFALLFPSINTLLIHATDPDNRGQAYGFFYALFSCGVVAGSSGLALLPASVKTQFLVTGAILMLCVISIVVWTKNSGRTRKEAFETNE